MKLVIEKELAQKILDHLATAPTGAAPWRAVNEMIQELIKLQPLPEPKKRSKKNVP